MIAQDAIVKLQLEKLVMDLKFLQDSFYRAGCAGKKGEEAEVQLRFNAKRFVTEAQILEQAVNL